VSSLATDTLSVYVVDDSELFRTAIRMLVETEPGLHVIGDAADGAEALEHLAHVHLHGLPRPDVVVLDLVMPRLDGYAAFHELRTLYGHIDVLVFSAEDEDVATRRLAATDGTFIPKSRPVELIGALQRCGERRRAARR
jgi:DNA-binding NarL/FixJ family response regulator